MRHTKRAVTAAPLLLAALALTGRAAGDARAATPQPREPAGEDVTPSSTSWTSASRTPSR